MGCDNTTTMPFSAAMWDDYFSRGGNTFDTAYVYGGGLQEKLLGQWIKNRGVREDVSVIVKGAHTPFCTPEHLTSQLEESLGRLQTPYADIYMLHRDNLEVPIGEFVEVLNEHVKAGRIRAFGGSNWTLKRVEAANRYAKQHKLTGFTTISNNFSLAEMIDPVWGGCVAVSDAASRKWLTKHQVANFSWSSQARGFFAGRAHPDDKSDAELVRCWYSKTNFRRLERAKQLAQKRGVLPINIAAAYVLCQPFPSFALIGPRTIRELVTSFPALDIELSPDELRWLNLESDKL
jgi:aryl-alcohol dehydrogenase-like predicted oxidoreductase